MFWKKLVANEFFIKLHFVTDQNHNLMRIALKLLTSISLIVSVQLSYSQDDAAAASATGSAAAPAKGAPKAAEGNSKLRVLHIAIHKHGFSVEDIKKLVHSGEGLDALHNVYKDAALHPDADFASHGDLMIKGHSADDAHKYAEFLRDPANAGKSIDDVLAAAKAAHADKYADPSLLIKDAESLTLSRYGSSYDKTAQFSTALGLATTLLTDKAITSDIPSTLSVSSLTSGYNLAFARLLSAYGALGANGEDLAAAVLGTDYSGYSSEATLSSLAKNSTNDYLSFLSTLTGERTFADENTGSSVLDVPLGNVQLAGASTITLGASGGTTPSEVNVGDKLTKATSSAERKVLVIGAAKDLKAAGDIKFVNSNNAEDHALVLGAADDVMIDGTDIEYTGSNLGIGSGDTGAASMYLVNTNITTGGNLAAGSLGTMNISNATFSVGTANSSTSDPDNVYLYANELLDINNLAFSGRVDDIYMESRTIHLKNTVFPATADVMLRSQNGALNIQSTITDIAPGAVNFYQVKHIGISNDNLTRDLFQGVDGHINSKSLLPNGTPYIKVRSQ